MFERDSLWNRPIPTLEELKDEQEHGHPERQAKPTAQVPFERWYNELNDVLAFGTLDDSVKDVIQGVTDEIYSYLKG